MWIGWWRRLMLLLAELPPRTAVARLRHGRNGTDRHFPDRRESVHGGCGEAIHGFHAPGNACPFRPRGDGDTRPGCSGSSHEEEKDGSWRLGRLRSMGSSPPVDRLSPLGGSERWAAQSGLGGSAD